MTQTEHLVKRLPNDIGGLQADPIVRTEHELEAWEKRCHALADVLDYHKLINTEEKRCGVEALGAEMVGKLTYYERWIVAFANILFRKGILTPTEVALKMKEVEARWSDVKVDDDGSQAGRP
jgi:Nitrile hydratase beta subunit